MLEDGRGQQAGLSAAAKRLQDRMPIVQRIEAELGAIDHGAQAGRQDVRPPCPALSRHAQFAVVAVGQHLIAEEEDDVAAALEIGVERVGLAGGELGDIAEEEAVVAAQAAFQERAFRGDVGLHQRRRPACSPCRRQRHGQIVGGAVEGTAGRPPVDAQRADRLPDRQGQIAVIVDVQGIAGGADLDRVIARRVEAAGEPDRGRSVRREFGLLLRDPPAIDEQFDELAAGRLAAEVSKPDQQAACRGRR